MNFKTTAWLAGLATSLFLFIFLYERHLPEFDASSVAADSLLPGFDPASVWAIELTRSNRLVLRAERTNDAWTLSAPIRYPAQQTTINNLLATISLLKRRAVMTADELIGRPEAPAEFGISPPEASLVLHSKNGRREFLLGHRTLAGDQVYFQLVGTPGIFLADAAVLDRIPASPNVWRDTTFVSLKNVYHDRIKVRYSGQGYELRRDPTNQIWLIAEPVRTRADNAKIDYLLYQLQNAQVRQFLTEGSTIDFERYGLQPPDLSVAFAMGPKDQLVIDFGKNTTNDPPWVYARRSDQTNVVLLAKELADQFRQPYIALRDRQLITVPFSEIDSIEVRAAEHFILVRQTNQLWQVVAPANFPADSELVKNFLNALSTLQILDFFKETVTDFSTYGLAAPARQYLLGARRGPTNQVIAQIDLGTNVLEQVDKIFARRDQENSVYTVSYGDISRLPAAAFQIRDRQIWNFASSNVTSLSIQLRGQSRKLIRDAAGEWTLPPVYQGTINSFAVQDVVEELSQLRAVHWTARGDEQLVQLRFPETALRIVLEVKTADKIEPFWVEFGRLAPSQRPYASVVLDNQRLIFEFPAALYDKVLLYLANVSPGAAGR
jgi:hypothetical protein